MLRILIQCSSYPPTARVVDTAAEFRERSRREAMARDRASQPKSKPRRGRPVRPRIPLRRP